MAITREQVFAAADRLDEAGAKATVQDVRALVGGGSFTTLSAWLQDWRVRRAADHLVSQDLEVARARISELEASRRDLQARIQVLEMALLTARQLIEATRHDAPVAHEPPPARRPWELTGQAR